MITRKQISEGFISGRPNLKVPQLISEWRSILRKWGGKESLAPFALKSSPILLDTESLISHVWIIDEPPIFHIQLSNRSSQTRISDPASEPHSLGSETCREMLLLGSMSIAWIHQLDYPATWRLFSLQRPHTIEQRPVRLSAYVSVERRCRVFGD
jgi:hypothetical protein